MEADDDDAKLLAAVAEGDASAFQCLLRRHAPRVLAFARAVLDDAMEAEDVTQEVFIRLWQQPLAYDPQRAAFSTWLYRVTRNAASNHRERVRGREQRWDETMPEPVDETPGPEARYAETEDAQRFDRARARLPEAQRSALALVYGQGLSNRDAASAMALSVKALEALLVRARRGLRASLGGAPSG